MNLLPIVLSSLLAATPMSAAAVPVPHAQPQPAESSQDDRPRNAAVDYWRAGYLQATQGQTEGEKPLHAIDFAKIGANLDPAKMPPEFAAAREIVSSDAMNDLIRAGKAPFCDFQLDLSQGPYLLLPHLSLVRDLTRAARVDARSKLMEGKPEDAAERIAAMFRASGHISQGGILINSLVGAAIARQACEEAVVLAESGRATPRALEIARDALDSLTKNDPFNTLGAIRGERELLVSWLRRQYEGPDGPQNLNNILAELSLMQGEQAAKDRLESIKKLNRQQMHAEFDKLDRYYTDLIAAWPTPNAEPELQRIEAAAAKGDYGLLSYDLGPSLSRARTSSRQAAEELRKAREILNRAP